MTTFDWKNISEEKIADVFNTLQSGRPKKVVGNAPHKQEAGQKMSIVVPEGQSLELPILEAQAGISLLEITLKPHSQLKLTYLQNGTETQHSVMIIRTTLEEGAHLESFFGMFGGAISSLLVDTQLAGAQSTVQEKTIYFGNGDQIFDMFSNTVLTGKNSTAEIESKGILTGRAQGRFDGNIIITQSAKQSQARLLEHTLLLSPEAKMNAIPGLKIETNDVMATHSASMTRVDEEQLFYAAARGIDEETAIRAIAEGFLKTLAQSFPEPEKVEELIAQKFKHA
ncbi:MAG: SufD family Fe-S cluster assembly protein [Patescibacteria group bacterium]